jgi:hypothetical protein
MNIGNMSNNIDKYNNIFDDFAAGGSSPPFGIE